MRSANTKYFKNILIEMDLTAPKAPCFILSTTYLLLELNLFIKLIPQLVIEVTNQLRKGNMNIN